jgi:hypothetical protein
MRSKVSRPTHTLLKNREVWEDRVTMTQDELAQLSRDELIDLVLAEHGQLEVSRAQLEALQAAFGSDGCVLSSGTAHELCADEICPE